MSQCKKFAPNIFHKTKCTNCFRQKEEHSAEALECNRASRSIARSGYLFVAPDWDFSVPLNRTKRWQRRWFVLYDDGELNYSVDEHPDTIPQGSVDMSKVLEVTGAEQVTGHQNSLALTSPDRVTFIKAASREDARGWVDLLSVFPRRHKRNATFPGGRASPSLPHLGRSASPQPPRPRQLTCISGPSPRTNFETPPLKEERESPPKDGGYERPGWTPTDNVPIEVAPSPIRNDYLMSSGSPPTRDKLRCDDKARARRDWRNERLRDIATALTDRSPESSLTLPAEGLLHLKKGWLWLKPANGELVRRWLVLSGPSLTIYRDQDEHATPELCVELSTVTSFNEIVTESKFGFEIKWSGPSLVLSAVTAGIRSNWLQALKKAAPHITIGAESAPSTPLTPRSVLFSSDEEYRTASEGGRRGSEDWGEVTSPCRTLAWRGKEQRTRVRPRLPRCQSRQSTLDSTSTDELDCMVKLPDNFELNNALNRQNVEIGDLQKQLFKALEEITNLEDEIARLKKFQAEAVIQEKKAKETMLSLERTERDLNQRNSQAELKFLKEQRGLQRRLLDNENLLKTYEDKYNSLSRELQAKQRVVSSLQDELSCSNERFARLRDENDTLFKRLQELENRSYKTGVLHIDSLTELTNIDLDVDLDEMGANELQEYCLDLRGRFEKSILEIRAVKRELRQAQENCDRFELENYTVEKSAQVMTEEKQAEIDLLVARLEHLTAKLSATEKQFRSRSKSDARDKRRSLSLKGRESISINKEVEDKVTELEAKILAMEHGRTKRKSSKRDRSSDRNSPIIDDKSLRRLRRKSLDSATSSEPMKLLMRLSTLESQVTNHASTESLNTESGATTTTTTKITECLHQLSGIRLGLKRPTSPLLEKIHILEQNLRELELESDEITVINASTNAVVNQLQSVLINKLSELNERKRMLAETNQLDAKSKLEILAEKVAYENILVNRIQKAISSTPVSEGSVCERLINKEVQETVHLMHLLKQKLNGSALKQAPYSNRTSAEYLSKILAKCLISASGGFQACKNYVQLHGPTLEHLEAEQRQLTAGLDQYKAMKLPLLAEILAVETSCCREAVDSLAKTAKEAVNSELMQAEINHVLQRAGQVYQSALDADNGFFFAFFASERAALELWSDSVGEFLYDALDRSAKELTELHQSHLVKLQRQNWRRRVESERNSRNSSDLLAEFADVVAHKAMIDARIAVFSGQAEVAVNRNSELRTWLRNENYWDCLENQSVHVSADLEAEFALMVDRSGEEVREAIRRFDAVQPGYLGSEYESLRAAYRRALVACKERHAEESDIEQLQHLCERMLVAMEQWHRRTIEEMRETHGEEIVALREEKEQALAEETQATLAALDAMRKAHEAEVQREVAKFKLDFRRQQRDDVRDLTERLAVKCREAAALEEQLGSATRQLKHAKQQMQQMERNPQLSPMQN